MAFVTSTTVSGLISYSIGIPAAGPYPVQGKLTLPQLTEGSTGNSQCVVTITQTPSGGSPTTIYTGSAGAEGFGPFIANCAAGDTLTFTMSSSAAVDQTTNSIKTTISVG